jgi:hypothetical protein
MTNEWTMMPSCSTYRPDERMHTPRLRAAYQNLDDLPFSAERLLALGHTSTLGNLVIDLLMLRVPLHVPVPVGITGTITAALLVDALALRKVARAHRRAHAVRDRPEAA